MRKGPNKIGALTQAKFIRLVIVGESTTRELAAETGMHPETARKYLRALHSEGAVYVHHYEPDRLGRYCEPVYQIKLGDEKDARRYAENTKAAHRERLRLRRHAAARARRLQARVAGMAHIGENEPPRTLLAALNVVT